MTDRDSGDKRAPHRPQHAARPGFSGPVAYATPVRSTGSRQHTRPASHPVSTAAVWVAALCLSVAAIPVVMSLTTAHPRPAPAVRQLGPAVSPTGPAAPSGTGHSEYRVVAYFSGAGNLTTRQFSVRAGLRWQLRWAYRCPGVMGRGQFIVAGAGERKENPRAGADVEKFARQGQGTTWLEPGGPSRSLEVISTCSWTMRVVQEALSGHARHRRAAPDGRRAARDRATSRPRPSSPRVIMCPGLPRWPWPRRIISPCRRPAPARWLMPLPLRAEPFRTSLPQIGP